MDSTILATFAAIAALAAVALVPLVLALVRTAPTSSRRESTLTLHRAQLAELDRELAAGRIGPTEHASARLEVQRRLLSAAEAPEEAPSRASRLPLLVTLAAVPVAALALYLHAGHPELPAAPLASRIAEADQAASQANRLIETLRGRLKQLDPKSDVARQGYVLLGNAEASRGRFAAAAAAWRTALAVRWDAALAAETAEAQTRAEGHVSPESAALFRRALAEGPPDAPWRKLAQQRLDESQGGTK